MCIRDRFEPGGQEQHDEGRDNQRRDKMCIRDREDPLHQVAGLRNGVMSIIIGIAANLSMEKGRQIKIADLIDTDHPALR